MSGEPRLREPDQHPARLAERDKPWVMRTYAGHSSRRGEQRAVPAQPDKGQTGLSVAFDLPTQTGYDPDHVLARGEVGRVGVPVTHLGDARALFHDLDLGAANTSMTINATAMWLLALYVTVAQEQGAPVHGTSPAPPRTTSSRSTCPAVRISSRPGRRCGSPPT